MNSSSKQKMAVLAAKIRIGIIESTFSAQSGHPGGSLSMADFMAYLYGEHINVDCKNPKWEGRDRFVLSKGHASPCLYSTLANCGFFPVDLLKTFRHPGSILQGHPDMKGVPGVDMSTGSLGQGISAAVGMAISAKKSGESWRVYTVLGDGELQEGQVWEAAMFAAHKKLDNLCVVVDNNNLQIDGALDEVNSPYPIDEKFAAFGFNVINIDGHNFDEIEDALDQATAYKEKPTAIIMKTIKGKGVSFMENLSSWHGVAPNKEQYETAMTELNAQLAAAEGGNK